jgi:hypothetical protein
MTNVQISKMDTTVLLSKKSFMSLVDRSRELGLEWRVEHNIDDEVVKEALKAARETAIAVVAASQRTDSTGFRDNFPNLAIESPKPELGLHIVRYLNLEKGLLVYRTVLSGEEAANHQKICAIDTAAPPRCVYKVENGGRIYSATFVIANAMTYSRDYDFATVFSNIQRRNSPREQKVR